MLGSVLLVMRIALVEQDAPSQPRSIAEGVSIRRASQYPVSQPGKSCYREYVQDSFSEQIRAGPSGTTEESGNHANERGARRSGPAVNIAPA